MKDKIRKYISYSIRFAKSQNKKQVIQDLAADIKEKGFITGVRSILYKKSHFYFDNLSYDTSGLCVKEYDKSIIRTLPNVDYPKVSIIIPMYNQMDYTFNCICAILENNTFSSYEVIIANDNSTDDTKLLKERFENLIVIRNETNLGFLKNCNHAASKARGEYVVFLNNDTQVQEDWLSELLAAFDNFKQVGMVGSKLIYPDGSLQEAGGIIWQDGSGWNYGNRDLPSKPQYNYIKETDYISGASIMILKKLWDEMGGFDERYTPAYYEDTDIAFEIRKRGYKVLYQPFSKVVHFEGISHGTDLAQGVKQYQVVNKEKFIKKWEKELAGKAKNGNNVFLERERGQGIKHILIVDHYLPQVDKDAGSRCISSYIDALQGLNYNVKFLSENVKVSRPYMKLFQEKGIELLYGNEFNFSLKGGADKYEQMSLAHFDAILLSRSVVCAPVLAFLRKHNYKGNIIYFGHDLGYLRMEKEAAAKNDQALAKLAKKTKEQEDYMYNESDNSIVVSLDEIKYLEKYVTKPLHYIPLFSFDVADKTPGFEEREGLLFVGGFNHPPNLNGITWFLDNVYPALHQQNIKLAIVGSKMPDSIIKYQQKYKLLTVLPDAPIEVLNDLYAHCKLSIVPLLTGAGVKGKVIESMAKGVPVAGTDAAFEGMPKDNAFLYKGYNSPSDMTTHLLRLYTNKKDWDTLSDFGKKYVSDNFNKEKIKEVFRTILEGPDNSNS